MPRALTTEEFKKKAKLMHPSLEYPRAIYVRGDIPVIVTCPKHGDFQIKPCNHIHGRKNGCRKCGHEASGLKHRRTLESFIEDSLKHPTHKDKGYKYGKTVYVDRVTPVVITCPVHGDFHQRPADHLAGSGCPECAKISAGLKHRVSEEEFLQRSMAKNGDKYSYPETHFDSVFDKIPIICPEHGVFLQTPTQHMNGRGCPKCGFESSRRWKTAEEFIQNALKHPSHQGKGYDYSEVEYKGSLQPVTIICPEHGRFEQTPSTHLQGSGCPQCGALIKAAKTRLSQEEFIQKSSEAHDNKYDYSKAVYAGTYEPVTIICPEHGEFELTPSRHIYYKQGCPACSISGFNATKPARLYYLAFDLLHYTLYKIGVTNRAITDRFSREPLPYRVLLDQPFEAGQHARSQEQSILKRYKNRLYQGDPVLKDGNSELFYCDVLGLDRGRGLQLTLL